MGKAQNNDKLAATVTVDGHELGVLPSGLFVFAGCGKAYPSGREAVAAKERMEKAEARNKAAKLALPAVSGALVPVQITGVHSTRGTLTYSNRKEVDAKFEYGSALGFMSMAIFPDTHNVQELLKAYRGLLDKGRLLQEVLHGLELEDRPGITENSLKFIQNDYNKKLKKAEMLDVEALLEQLAEPKK